MKEVYFETKNPAPDDYVRFVQKQLNKIRISLISTLPPVDENGKYDKATADVVQAFQQVCNIRADRKFGPQTRACLVQKLQELHRMQTAFPISNKSTSSFSLTDMLDFFVQKIAAPMADCLSSASDLAISELKKLNSQNFKITDTDIRKLERMLFDRFDVKKLQETIKKQVFEEATTIAKGDTNVVNYVKNGKHATQQIQRAQIEINTINSAKTLLNPKMTGLSNAGMNTVKKRLLEQLLNKTKEELGSVNFSKKLTVQITTKRGSIKIPGCGILTAISLIPLVKHFAIFFYYYCSGQSTEQIEKEIIQDIVSLIEGVLIGFVVSAVVASFLSGGIAIAVIIIICLLIGLALTIFLPEHEKKISEGIYEWIHSSSLPSSSPLPPSPSVFFPSPVWQSSYMI